MRNLIAVAAVLIATPAWADEREYCPERPGLGTPACTMAPGRVSVETSIADWQRDDTVDSRTDTVLIGDTLVRVGVTDTIEAQVGWTPFGHVRTRDKASGSVDTANRVGDVSLGLKANLMHPDGQGLSIAVLPYVTLPVGRSPVGAGDWGTGVLVPVTYDLSDTLNLQLTPEVDAAVNEDGNGRHLAYSAVAGLGVKLSKAVTGTVEFKAERDDDPGDHVTQALAALSFGWMANAGLQFDVEADAGLNRDTPDVELIMGVARRF